MGYTHYWTQPRSFTPAEWEIVSEHIQEILSAVASSGVTFAGNCGDAGTKPEFDENQIGFNGFKEDAHETFLINRVKEDSGWNFCKTAYKPYDVAVTACLAYLGCVHGWGVSSDGEPGDWAKGVAFASAALPAHKIECPLQEEVA